MAADKGKKAAARIKQDARVIIDFGTPHLQPDTTNAVLMVKQISCQIGKADDNQGYNWLTHESGLGKCKINRLCVGVVRCP